MIRPLTLLSLIAAGGAGLHLYSVKHEVSTLERELRDIGRQTEAARERTAVLRAEWALLNEPERLRAAAARLLPLEPMQTAQFVRPAEVERRLPTVVAFAGPQNLFAPASATMVAAATPAAAAAVMAAQANAAAPAANGAATAQARAAQPAAAVASPAAAQPPAAARASAPVQVAAAPAREAVRPAAATPRAAPEPARAAPAPQPRAPEVTQQAAAPAQPTIRPAIYLAPVARQAEPPVPTGSALGAASRPMLAPPVPFGAAQAASPPAR
ncbi:hypothetical protein ACE7GA_18300 [Roseomonas sp. CCTCC AB2023176]|uniref:cell division protein FtsL n=1 Tax=Roseomonas sp. CCTCC AB2023176 TaxID=3342640 RepID=UPI0035DEB3B0